LSQLVDQIIAYAQKLRYKDLPAEVVARTKELILDTVGCALGGATSPPAGIAQSLAKETSSARPATVIGRGYKTSPDLATFANGIAARYLDYNDTYLGGGHPSDMLAPVLACCDAVHGDGKAAILGTVLAYEVYCGTRDGAEGRFKAEGRRPYGNQTAFGPFGAAAAASRLLGLDAERMRQAINLAAVSHFPPSGGPGQLSHWKACHLANASRVAVFSAMLAERGLTAPDGVLGSGDSGYFAAVGAEFGFEPYDSAAGSFRIMRSHVKAFPCGFHGMGPATAAAQIHPRIAGSIDAVREVRVHATRISAQLMGGNESRWRPETRETADHSIPFVVAMVLMHGSLEVRHYDDELFKAPAVREFMSRVKIVTPETYESDFHAVPSVLVEVALDSGAVEAAEVKLPLGHPQNPMTAADYERKFRSLARPLLPEPQIDRLLDRLWRLEEARDIGEVLSLTVAPDDKQA
jgi:2-methylcitrate dehydratase